MRPRSNDQRSVIFQVVDDTPVVDIALTQHGAEDIGGNTQSPAVIVLPGIIQSFGQEPVVTGHIDAAIIYPGHNALLAQMKPMETADH